MQLNIGSVALPCALADGRDGSRTSNKNVPEARKTLLIMVIEGHDVYFECTKIKNVFNLFYTRSETEEYTYSYVVCRQ